MAYRCVCEQKFLEGLLEAYAKDVEAHKADEAVLLSAAAVELLRVNALLADHAVALGSVDKLLRILAAHVPPPAGEPQWPATSPS
jgi:hypothetical protein